MLSDFPTNEMIILSKKLTINFALLHNFIGEVGLSLDNDQLNMCYTVTTRARINSFGNTRNTFVWKLSLLGDE